MTFGSVWQTFAKMGGASYVAKLFYVFRGSPTFAG